MATTKLHEFTVEGVGEFPLDMLRYDHCWPKGESSDVVAIAASHRRGRPERATVRLVGTREPTRGRWLSFGWEVIS